MTTGEIIAAIDIGSSKIKTLVGSFSEDKKLRILGVGLSPSTGVRKGNILDMDEFRKNIDTSLLEAEKMLGQHVNSVYLSLSGVTIESVINSGVVAVANGEVSEDDVNRAMDMSQNGVDMTNRTILKVVPESFTIDGTTGIKNPIGMGAKKLEVRSHIISIAENVLSNVRKGILDVGVDIVDVFANVLSAPEAVLSRRQKELGVVCIDIGASTTDVAVFEEGALIFSAVIALGGEHVTSDIALGLRISIDLAEKLKLEHADVNFCKDDSQKDEEIDLSKYSKTETTTISKKYLSEIVRARYSEFFYFVNSELKRIGKDGMLPEGAVLTGGAAKIRGLVDLSKEILRLPTSIGIPDDGDHISGTSLGDPQYAGIVGTLLLSQKYTPTRSRFKFNFSTNGFFSSLKQLIQKILP